MGGSLEAAENGFPPFSFSENTYFTGMALPPSIVRFSDLLSQRSATLSEDAPLESTPKSDARGKGKAPASSSIVSQQKLSSSNDAAHSLFQLWSAGWKSIASPSLNSSKELGAGNGDRDAFTFDDSDDETAVFAASYNDPFDLQRRNELDFDSSSTDSSLWDTRRPVEKDFSREEEQQTTKQQKAPKPATTITRYEIPACEPAKHTFEVEEWPKSSSSPTQFGRDWLLGEVQKHVMRSTDPIISPDQLAMDLLQLLRSDQSGGYHAIK